MMPKSSPQLKTAVTFATAGERQKLSMLLEEDEALACDPRVLSAAALHGHSEIVLLLLDAGADPNAVVPSHECYRPLHRAIEHRGVKKHPGHLAATKILMDRGADLTARGTWMQLTPLGVAGMTGDMDFIELVLQRNPPRDIFSAAILADSAEVASTLSSHPESASSQDENNLTVLHYTALSGLRGESDQKNQRQIVTLLLDAGAAPGARPDIGPYKAIPVLHFTGWNSNFAVAETLLERGANPNYGFGNCLWREPLTLANLFLAYGADVNGFDSPGTPLIHSRIRWNLPKIVLWLIENGANPQSTDKDGNTPLHIAVVKGINPQVIEALLACGASLTARNQAGETPLDKAKKSGKQKTLAQMKDW